MFKIILLAVTVFADSKPNKITRFSELQPEKFTPSPIQPAPKNRFTLQQEKEQAEREQMADDAAKVSAQEEVGGASQRYPGPPGQEQNQN